MLDKDKVKSFWDSRAITYQTLAFESIANLEQDPDNLRLKIELETKKVSSYLGSVSGKSVLDLGAGVGQWSFRFVDSGAASVTAVEYSEPLAEIGRREASRRSVHNISFVISAAELYHDNSTYDIVFISGLFVYLNDDQASLLIRNLKKFCYPGTIIILRDGTGIHGRHGINNRMSEHLEAQYSAIYRTRKEYLTLFGDHGFGIICDENMFSDGCPLNKYPETRLRIYRFSVCS